MKLNYKRLGQYIRAVDVRNSDGKEDNLLGVSVQKVFMPSIANTVGTDFTKYKVVKRGQFTYIPDTSRRGDKIGIALLEDYEEGLVSNVYTVFEIIDEKQLIPQYLMLWFSRPEFDRYARFKSHGSVREVFDWDELCKVELPVPPYEEQLEIVNSYRAITERIALKKWINDNLTETVQAIYRSMFLDAKYQFEHKPLSELCSKIGSGATPKGGKTAYCDTGITLIRSTNVVDYGFIYDGLAHITNEQADALSNVVVNSGDVLFNITGVSVARCCMVPDDVIPARVNQHVMIIRPVMGKDMSYYIMATLCHSENKSKLLGIAQSGSTREAINKQEMEQFTIPVPFETAVHEFGRKVETLFTNISTNINEIRQLLDMQRLLLSRLSSR
ncbi:restriction endonuclease subunit S [Neglecta sp. X4]|uniref:restriction endonuclease subunit S n=1 Tax=unclassified Neglectibacter TaxID=2632164 RepID=UPI00136DCD3C|nr:MULTISPECIES: restriction endonuclease subunit S [unclassified Neglectibacter]NBI16699.1 restriction endonuclease subunit S [Neglectibacter sp. 59]NBJ72979.1 restriction endonuclease subunit S [Neglectibacter sp. X4]NBK79601.1 restriction endonuclease subunit S [bacterium D16-76]